MNIFFKLGLLAMGVAALIAVAIIVTVGLVGDKLVLTFKAVETALPPAP